MKLKNKYIRVIHQKGSFHIIEPLNNKHLITDALGAFIINALVSNIKSEDIFSRTAERFKTNAVTIHNYLREFTANGLLTNHIHGALYHNDYIHDYTSIPDGYSFHPNFLYWVITWNCNLRCRMCPLWSSNSAGHTINALKDNAMLSLNECKKVIANIAKSRLSVIHITGGEPLLYPHLIEAVKNIKQYGIKVSVFSNGTLIDKQYARRLINTGIDKIGISLDGTESIHDLIRGKGNFLRAKNGLINLLEARKQNAADTRIYIMNTITKYNYNNLLSLMKLAAKIGVDGMFAAHPSFTSPSSPELQKQILSQCFLPLLEGPSWNMGQAKITDEVKEIPIDALSETIAKLKGLAEKYNLEFASNLDMSKQELNNYYSLAGDKLINYCLWPWQGGFMDPNGRLYPCVKVNAGDLKKDDFLELWNSDLYRRFRRLLKNRGTLPCCERCCQLINEQAKTDAQLAENIIQNQNNLNSHKEVMQ